MTSYDSVHMTRLAFGNLFRDENQPRESKTPWENERRALHNRIAQAVPTGCAQRLRRLLCCEHRLISWEQKMPRKSIVFCWSTYMQVRG